MPDHEGVVTAADNKFAAEHSFTMQGLWRLAAWGATAACALLIAVLATRGAVVARHGPVAVAAAGGNSARLSPPPQVPAPTARPADAVAETQQLSASVRELAAEDDQLKSRLAAVEHTVNDVTGSLNQNAAAKPVAPSVMSPWPNAQAPMPPTTAAVAAMLAPGTMPIPTEYAVDIGSALSIPTLRARWAGLHSAHPELFAGMRPVVTLKQISRPNRVELRLVVGPLASAEDAAKLCADLMPYRLFCRPTVFGGQYLALE
jgi:hypothetical protein